jgi:2-phosphosulfolactate phosphatase
VRSSSPFRRPGARGEDAAAGFQRFRGDLTGALRQCASRKKLIERGFAGDVDLAAASDVSGNVPLLAGRCFVGS